MNIFIDIVSRRKKKLILLGYIFYMTVALLGITIGYHRYFTHKSFSTNKIAEVLMLLSGLICGGRSALTWAGVHRMHHANSDTAKDPHSPIYKGIAVLFSKWKVDYIPKKFIIDLIRNPRVRFFHQYGKYIYAAYCIFVLTFGLPAFYIFVVSPFILSWIGFGLLNYVTHMNGSPTDIPWLNIIGPGEGWHKYHHENPSSYRFHKYDMAGVVIEFIRTK